MPRVPATELTESDGCYAGSMGDFKRGGDVVASYR